MTNGFEEEQITTNGIVRSIVMSKNLRYIAFTTTEYDNYIHIIDLNETDQSNNVTSVPLRVPLNSEYASTVDLSYADVMSFNFRGDYLLFDAVQELPLASGEKLLRFGLYSMRMSDFSCSVVMQPQANIQYGNPSFAHTDDSLLLADVIVHEGDGAVYSTASLDFQQGKIGALMTNTGILGRPTFRGDDKQVVFRSYDPQQQQFLIVEGTLGSDRLSLVPDSLQLVIAYGSELNHPVGFRAGEYTAQEGKIAVPATLDFGAIDVGQSAEQTLVIGNQGNADLQVLSIAFEGGQADWFKHNGLDRRISPGEEYSVTVTCQPQQEGPIQAVVRIQSTDLNTSEVTVALQGTGNPAAQATPTPTPLPAGPGSIEPLVSYEFGQTTLNADGLE